MTLPTSESALAAGSIQDHVDWHNEIDSLLPFLGLPTVSTATTTGHVAAHEALHAFIGGLEGDLPLDITASATSGHRLHDHLEIHQYLASTTVSSLTTASDIQAAMTAGSTGQVFGLAAGTYEVGVNFPSTGLAPKAGQTLYGAYGAVLCGAKPLTSWTASGSDFFATRLTGTAASAAPDDPGDGARCEITGCENRHDMFRDGVPLVRVASQGALGAGKFWEDFTNNRVYIRDTPSGHTVKQALASYVWHPTTTGTKLRNLIVEMAANAAQTGAVEMDGADSLTECCEIRYNHGLAVRNNGNDSILRKSLIHHQMQMGLGSEGADDVLIEDVEIYNNNRDGSYLKGWEAGGTKWANCNRLTVRRVWSHDNHGIGIWADINNGNVVIEDCYVQDNEEWGIFYEISYGEVTLGDGLKTHIRRNVSLDNLTPGGSLNGFYDSGQIVVSGSRDVEVYENIVRGWDGIGATAQLRTDSPDSRGAHRVVNLHVYDNDIESTYEYPTSGTGWGNAGGIKTDDTANQDPEVWDSQGNSFEGNRYYVPNSPGDPNYPHWTWHGDLGTDFATFAQWQAYGQDTTAQGGSRTIGGHVTVPDPPTLDAGPKGQL